MEQTANESPLNLAAHLEGMPPVYDKPPQDDTARAYAQSLMRVLRAGRKPDRTEMEWLTLYNKHKAKSRNRDEADEYIEEYNKKDIHLFFMDKIAKLQEGYDKRIADILTQHRKDLADKDRRIDEIIAKQQEQKGKDFGEMVRLVAAAGKEGADNANKHLTQALTTTNSLNSTLMSSLSNQYKHTEELDKKRREEVLRLIEQKEKEEPGWLDILIEKFLIPNQDKIGNTIEKYAGPLLTDISK